MTPEPVTLANWQDPPFSRWSFQHVRELIPTARITAAAGPALPRAEQDLSGLAFHCGGRDWTIGEFLAASHTDGFLVLHRGHVVAEHYGNGMTPGTPHLLMSVSKSVVSAVAGILAGRGVLDPAAGVTSIVPELAATSFAGAAIQHLLDMRTGTRFSEDYSDPDADVRRYEQVYLWRPRGGGPVPPGALSYFATLGNDGPHGGPFRYRSILTDVLAWVIERAAGTRLAELIARELWQPMGAEYDAEITLDPHGNPMADGGICATLRDLGRFGQLFATGGGGIVPAAWIEDTVRGAPDGAAAFTSGDNPPGYPAGAHYRNCWWVRDPGVPFFHASGINGQHVLIHPPSQTVVVKLSCWPSPLSQPLLALTVAATHAIAAALGGPMSSDRGQSQHSRDEHAPAGDRRSRHRL